MIAHFVFDTRLIVLRARRRAFFRLAGTWAGVAVVAASCAFLAGLWGGA